MYLYRPARCDDLPAVQALLAAIAAVEPDSYGPTLEDVQLDFADTWSDPEMDSRVAVTGDGNLVAYARVWANPEPVDDVHAYTDIDVHPSHRNDQLEEQLLDWLEARGAERVRAIAAANPGHQSLILRLVCWDTEADHISRYERHGFRPVRSSYRMRRDLRQPIPERPLPAGLVLRTYHPELDEQIRQARNESFSDSWGFEPVTPSDWQHFFVQRATFRPDLSFAILDGDQVVAFSMNRYDAAEAERTGFRAGWIGSLGTRRAWRKRGLASALLVHSMRAFQAVGLEYAGLGVDAENPTGALGLYEHLGFKPYARRVTLGKPVGDQGLEIKAIVFDFGGVLVRTEDQTRRRQWETRLGLGERDLAQLVFDSDVALRATVGEVPDTAIWEHVASALKLTADQMQMFRTDFWAGDKLDPDLVGLLSSLRPRYKTAILSNAWSSGRETIARRFGLEQAVDTIIISAEERLAKPDARLYQRVAERLGVQPNEAVLVDDFFPNVEGARAAGWQAVHYRAGLDMRGELEKLGVVTNPKYPQP